jgi:hypothetical protein
MSVVFGRRSALDDPDIVELFETLELFLENQQPGVNIVDAFPILARLPKMLQWWRPMGEAIFEKTRKLVLAIHLYYMKYSNFLRLQGLQAGTRPTRAENPRWDPAPMLRRRVPGKQRCSEDG